MALEFIDSCSHSGFGGAQIPPSRKWTGYSQVSYTNSPNRRTGQIVLAVTGGIGKTLAYKQTRVVGFAYYYPNASNQGQVVSMSSGFATMAYVFIEVDKTVSIYSGGNNIRIFNSGASHYILQTDAYHYFEFKVTLGGASPVTVSCSLQIDGATIASNIAGHTSTNASDLFINAAEMNAIGFSGVQGGSFTAFYTDVYVLNTDTTDINGNTTTLVDFLGDVAVDALIPIADITTQFQKFPSSSPNSFSLVSEIPPDDDTTYVFSDTVGQVDTFKFQQIIGFTGVLLGAQLLLYAKKDAEGARAIAGVVGGTTVNNLYGSQSQLFDYYDYYIYPLDSNNGVPWNPTNYNSQSFGALLSA